MALKRLLVAGLLGLTILPLAGYAVAASVDSDVADARAATAIYHRVGAAQAAGYGQFLGCVAEPGLGAMGIHFVNGSLAGDTILDPTKPEALVYEPQSFGRLALVATEYIVFKAAWDAGHASPPSLFNTTFDLVTSQPVRAAPVLRAACVDLEAESERHVHSLEPARELPAGLIVPSGHGRGQKPGRVRKGQAAAGAGAREVSSSPKRARFTNWPLPGCATTSPPSTITFPRKRTVSTSPTTSVPS
jgi:hypothetical protein